MSPTGFALEVITSVSNVTLSVLVLSFCFAVFELVEH